MKASFQRIGLAACLWVGAVPSWSLPPEPTHPESGPLLRLVQEQAEAWNRGDATAWSQAFAEDADFVNILGGVFAGREEIERRHAAIFSSFFKGSRNRVTVRRLTFPIPGLAILDTDQEVTGYASLPPGVRPTRPDGALVTHMKYVVQLRDGAWRILSGQNTEVKPLGPRP